MDDQKVLQPDKFEGMSIFRPPLCHELAGRSFLLDMDDGWLRRLELLDQEKLHFGNAEGTSRGYSYECVKADETTYFVNFEEEHVYPRNAYTVVLDLEQNLVTLTVAHMGQDPKYPKMPAVEFIFGGIVGADGKAPKIRHGYTPDLVGRAINWNYGTFDVIHVYSSERYYRVAFSQRRIQSMIEQMKAQGIEPPKPEEGQRRGVYEDFAAYIKIKDGLYLVSLLETQLCRQRGHGNSLLFLMNLKEMHDVGRSFGTNDEGNNENYLFGAFGEDYDASDTLARESTYYIR